MIFSSRSSLRVARVLCVLFVAGGLGAQGPGDALESGFRSPPEAARPRTWWHWTMSHVSQAGITKDLDSAACSDGFC